ncbi:MAG TPA: sugar phosphate isomerase/epimerase family protein [Planctomycetaceae bacterium]|jgi:sugar phosphate isomerase/epimerase|nr:sugar phosphate isomerase/epimerase family protein [Planctomycetaceae bacterium]
MPLLAFSTLACPDWPLAEVLERCSRYGYDGVEVRQIAGETDLLQVVDLAASRHSELRRTLGQLGITICGLASSVRFDYPHQATRDEQLRAGRAYVELAASLGARFVRVFGDVLPPANSGTRRATLDAIAEGLNRLGEFAAPHNVDILLETHGDFAESSVVCELMSQIDAASVGILWDTHHPWKFFDEPLAETWTQLKPWVRHTHWKDSVTRPLADTTSATKPAANEASTAAHSLMSGHREADYVLFGGGEFPAEDCARLLKDSGYTGWLSLEWEKLWHPQIEVPEVALPLFVSKMRALWERV